MAKQSITLKIAGKSYPFTIDSDKEEAYRLAEREVNNFLVTIKQKNFKGWNDLDYMSITALNFAITNVMSRQSREASDDDLRRLKQLESDIDSYLNNPRR
ncbi:cell division protein ZapA [Alistipes sp.]|uniref:cell division protein ZapA n=1 Tax=Alistipes sp. TaxID=1872444 RepID=UPI003A899295